MDRLIRLFAASSLTIALGMVLTASGCRSMHSDVPKGKPYTTNGNPTAPGFNSDPHPNTTVGPGLYQNNGSPSLDGNPVGGANATQYGTPTPSASPYGVPPVGKFGAPGTNNGMNN
jgi:hypothetical protein